ncbi:protein jim lovell-like [Diorhabda sublineata]|uniref:protein jim lovell-like n=1 Tax=Diorhabda sublineata TaxID=1163346 RepID=UPI0024E0E985|nr:protein jim lovell-like [Diorhabda sublineata]XP_056636534.1 protein jim lovell-like [Diorhabda sublineata]
MTAPEYFLRWNDHQSFLVAAFEALLQTETLVDVTLVCDGLSTRAHKVVLGACSPLFQQLFTENPCKHPIIVFKDFTNWEIKAIIEFMYRGEICVRQEQLPCLIKAAENLQVQGLTPQNQLNKKSKFFINQTPTPATSPNEDFDTIYLHTGRCPSTVVTVQSPTEQPISLSSCHSQTNLESSVRLPHMSRLPFPHGLPRPECHSPVPRRKQARPRRRSGDQPQDLSIPSSKSNSPSVATTSAASSTATATTTATATAAAVSVTVVEEETAENLCIKRPKEPRREVKKEKSRSPETSIGSPEMDLSLPSTKDFRTSPINMHHPVMNLKQEIDSHSPLPFPPMPSISALTMTQPHSKFFGLDSPLGLFPPVLESCRNPLFDIPDPRSIPDQHALAKKKMGRPKGQHSAPRGGPPRSWTNGELTEALQQVWNKKMTTSQASRIFGIPYNSLLMYVRGKYGKSLKLEQLRKDCMGSPNNSMDIMNIGGNTNNSIPGKSDSKPEQIQPNTRPPSTEDQQLPPPTMFNPFPHSFFPDFGSGFPLPVSMLHLLPQSEKNRTDHFAQQSMEEDNKDRAKGVNEEIQQDIFRPSSLLDRRELVQQNGQD